MGRHDDQIGAVLSQKVIDRENHLSPPQGRMSMKGPKPVPFKTLNVRQSTHTVRILTYEAILAHFRTTLHDDKMRNDKLSSFQDP